MKQYKAKMVMRWEDKQLLSGVAQWLLFHLAPPPSPCGLVDSGMGLGNLIASLSQFQLCGSQPLCRYKCNWSI